MTNAANSLERVAFEAREHAHLWTEPRFHDLECLAARFETHAFAPHRHETYVLGAIVRGGECFHYRGRLWSAMAGQVVLVEPEELHDGRAVSEFFIYRMFYPAQALVRGALAELESEGDLGFPEPVLDDPVLARRLIGLHDALHRKRTTRLAADVEMTEILAKLARDHAGRALPRPVSTHPLGLAHAQSLIDDRLEEDLSLAEVAAEAGLSPFQLIRAFRRSHGITPQAWRVERRTERAKALIRQGRPLADVAAACGFSDQSHLNRCFKARIGVTPGAYRRAVAGG